MSDQEIRSITPTFQAVLNKQLGKTTDALDVGNAVKAWNCIETLVLISPPKIRDPIIEEYIKPLYQELNQPLFIQLDDYLSGNLSPATIGKVLRKHTKTIFIKIMTELHSKNLLVRHSRDVEDNRPSTRDQLLEQQLPRTP